MFQLLDDIGKKWMKTDTINQYLTKVSRTKWEEYQDNKIYAIFEEINAEDSAVILKKQDGLILKLTDNAAFWGENENDIKYKLCNGNWLN